MDIISELNSYILNNDNITNYLKYKFKDTLNNFKDCIPDKKQTIYKNKIHINGLFFPLENDKLFWCYYIIKFGDISYELLSNKNKLIEKQLKISYIENIRNNKQILKIYKFDSFSNISNNLANDNNINIKSLISLFVIDKINLIFVKNKTYFELLMNDSDNIYIIYEIEPKNKYNKTHGFKLSTTSDLNEIRDTLYKLDTLDKPIKAFSSYKVQDLIDIANKLAIEIKDKESGKNKSKKDLYELILQYF